MVAPGPIGYIHVVTNLTAIFHEVICFPICVYKHSLYLLLSSTRTILYTLHMCGGKLWVRLAK